ncbi:class I SAM-dependent methyltransferase [Geothrix fuzhouensis]|uniref:class I SAM-dependent methyltransferase n=1 Tax=Geothrix fuzhouensis TaxID=2966451 RepID=UPI00214757E1|nr:class I SAM-dependent methyltransferase [Geothrix fuzhouensis]
MPSFAQLDVPKKLHPEDLAWFRDLQTAAKPVPADSQGPGSRIKRWISRQVARAAWRGGRDLFLDQQQLNLALIEALRNLSATVNDLVVRQHALLRQSDHPEGIQEALRAIREDLLAIRQREAPGAPIAQSGATSAGGESFDRYYRAFEDAFRGSEAMIEERLEVYVPRVKRAFVGVQDPLWLDLGCGRGEWLRVLARTGIRGLGVDSNQGMAEVAKNSGLDVQVGDLMECLRTRDAGSVDGLSAFHVVEHLPSELVIELLREGLRVVRPGGLLILETPNAENLQVGAHTFYLDPSHRSPVPQAFLAFMATQIGWEQAEILRLHGDERDLQRAKKAWSGNKSLLKAADCLFGPRDYALVAVRPLV